MTLADRIEELDGPSREVDWVIHLRNGPDGVLGMYGAHLHFTASIDAAMTLVPEGWNWMAGNRDQPLARAYVNNGQPAFVGGGHHRNPNQRWFECTAATPALALCAAALRAQEAEGRGR